MSSSLNSPQSGHLGTAWETAVVAVFGAFLYNVISSSLNITSVIAVIIVIVGVVAFYFRRRRIRRRLTDRIHSPANSTRDPEQGVISPPFEKSPRSREMRDIADVDASIAKVCSAVCWCGRRLILPLSPNVLRHHHHLAKVYRHLIIMKQRKNKERLNRLGITGSPSDFPPCLCVLSSLWLFSLI